jgi:copper(I)-binding protein
MSIRTFAWAGVLALAAVAAPAQTPTAGPLSIEGAWARPTVPGQPTGGAFLTIRNAGDSADRLLSASSPAAASVQVHEMKMEGSVMRMREVDGLDVPAHGSVTLSPGQYHLMLVGLKAPLKAGSEVPLALHFQKAGDLQVELKVRALFEPKHEPAQDHH